MINIGTPNAEYLTHAFEIFERVQLGTQPAMYTEELLVHDSG